MDAQISKHNEPNSTEPNRTQPDRSNWRQRLFTVVRSSATGTRTQVARVKAEYPNQLDYSGFRHPSIQIILKLPCCENFAIIVLTGRQTDWLPKGSVEVGIPIDLEKV